MATLPNDGVGTRWRVTRRGPGPRPTGHRRDARDARGGRRARVARALAGLGLVKGPETRREHPTQHQGADRGVAPPRLDRALEDSSHLSDRVGAAPWGEPDVVHEAVCDHERQT